jgi:hypothetical protein
MSSLSHYLLEAALCFAGLLSVSYAAPLLDERGFGAQDIITRDVCIIGGGATGTYSAVRLSQDMGKSVVIVEKTDRLGGHTETYIDPVTHYPVDYGVQAYHNLSVVTNFFARFNVSLTAVSLTSPFTTDYVDLRTGKVVPGYTPPDPTTALGILAAQLEKYPYLPEGYNLPDPVPADLLLPFGDFVIKYGIQAAVPLIWTFAHGLGDLLTSPTLYVFQNFGLPQLNSISTNSFLVTTDHDNSEVYLKASALLGSNVLYESTLVAVDRYDNDAQLITVQTPTGLKVIKAKKLLVTIPPILDNLGPFFLNNDEYSIFKQWQYTTYYTGIVRYGVPDDINVVNTAKDTTYNIPLPPLVQNFDFSGVPGLHTFSTVSLTPQTPAQVQALVTSDIAAMDTAGTFPASTPLIEVLSNHSPTQMRVSADAIKNGFYKDLYALQGLRGTFWTGAAWAQDDSSLLWAFTEGILPLVNAALA